MYKFHYEYVKNKSDAKLLFTDTDSLVYENTGKDVYVKSFQDRELFDFSNYPVNSRYYDPKNNAVLGKMKDEFKGKIISEFVGLKSKMYSLISIDDEEVSKGKGVNRKVVRHNMKRIQSKLHGLGTYDVCEISLSCFDDKRCVLHDGVNTLARLMRMINSIIKMRMVRSIIHKNNKVNGDDKKLIRMVRVIKN